MTRSNSRSVKGVKGSSGDMNIHPLTRISQLPFNTLHTISLEDCVLVRRLAAAHRAALLRFAPPLRRFF
jgi:hypothetical protein